MEKTAFGKKVDEVICKNNLFYSLMVIVSRTEDSGLKVATWKLIGFMCSCTYTPNNVSSFTTNTSLNLIDLIHQSLISQSTDPNLQILKNTLFALSNVIADGACHLERVLKMDMMSLLSKIWDYVLG